MYIVSASYVRGLLNMLQAQGLNVAQLCRDVELEARRLTDDDAFFERRTLYRLLERAALETEDPDIGLKVYSHFLPGSFQLVGYVMMSSPCLKDALERLIRFVPLLGSGFSASFRNDVDDSWRLSLLEHPETDSIRPRQFTDVGSAVTLGFCHWLTGACLPRPLAIEFDYPEPQDISSHQALFDCPLRFGAISTSILFDAQELLTPLNTANETLLALHEYAAQTRVSRLLGNSMVSRVRSLLSERLGEQACDLESTAAALAISKRTLQRSLEREGVRFKEILDSVRRQFADYYLRHSRHGYAEVAELLGFNDQSAFNKACLRWFGMPPGRYRHERDLGCVRKVLP